jgi:hypothetical protein
MSCRLDDLHVIKDNTTRKSVAAGSRAGAQRTQAISRRTVRGVESLKERKKERM